MAICVLMLGVISLLAPYALHIYKRESKLAFHSVPVFKLRYLQVLKLTVLPKHTFQD